MIARRLDGGDDVLDLGLPLTDVLGARQEILWRHAQDVARLARAEQTMRQLLAALPTASIEKVLGANACAFYGL